MKISGKKASKNIQNGGLKLTNFSDTKISGTVNAQEDSILYLSIPYEEGWSVQVDGQKAEVLNLFGAMCGVPLSAGSHNIKLSYSPKGFIPGVFIGIFCLGILVFLYFWEKQHPQPETEPEEDAEDAEQEEETEKSEESEEDTQDDMPKPENYEVLDAYDDLPEPEQTPLTEDERDKQQNQEIFDFIDSYFDAKRFTQKEDAPHDE